MEAEEKGGRALIYGGRGKRRQRNSKPASVHGWLKDSCVYSTKAIRRSVFTRKINCKKMKVRTGTNQGEPLAEGAQHVQLVTPSPPVLPW
jgi:hypothetical protein